MGDGDRQKTDEDRQKERQIFLGKYIDVAIKGFALFIRILAHFTHFSISADAKQSQQTQSFYCCDLNFEFERRKFVKLWHSKKNNKRMATKVEDDSDMMVQIQPDVNIKVENEGSNYDNSG